MGKHPWLLPADNKGSPLGGIDKLRRNYLVEDYLKDAAGHNVVGTVHIEALWKYGDALGETRWLDSLDKSQGIAARYVVAAPLGTASAADVIAKQAEFKRVVGIRGILSCHPDPKKCFVQRPDIAYDKDWRRDVGLIGEAGLHLELMMYPYQGQAVFDLAKAFPKLQIIVNHCASPIDRDKQGLQRWRDALKLISSRPNIALKISNPGAYDPQWTSESIKMVVDQCLSAFGVERAMFGTDFPVADLQMTFSEIYENFKAASARLGDKAQHALFHDNAKRFYRM